MAKEPQRERRQLQCPSELADDTVELLTFIQMPLYTSTYLQLELTDDEQRAIETGIMMNPTLSPVLPGTGGVREFQFGTPGGNPGSLHLSAFYCYFPEMGKVALLDICQTDESGELTDDERAQLKILFEEIQEIGPENWGS